MLGWEFRLGSGREPRLGLGLVRLDSLRKNPVFDIPTPLWVLDEV